jgi:hypothetical protein
MSEEKPSTPPLFGHCSHDRCCYTARSIRFCDRPIKPNKVSSSGQDAVGDQPIVRFAEAD